MKVLLHSADCLCVHGCVPYCLDRSVQFSRVKKIGRVLDVLGQNKMPTLYLVPTSAEAKAIYSAVREAYLSKPIKERDAGFDLVTDETTVATRAFGHSLLQQTSAALYDDLKGTFRAFWLLPRSSLSKTPLRLSNSVGLIDAGYRGTLIAKVDNHGSADVAVAKNTRYFQIAAPDLLPFDNIQIVDEIPGGATIRGAGGFGSTGLTTSSTIPGIPSTPKADEPNTITYFGI
jgi:dUTP pyrophosphatase